MDINLILEPRPAFSRNSFPQYTQAQTDTYSATYSRLLKDAGPPSPPRWARKNISLKKKPLTDSERRKVVLAHTPWIQSAQGSLKRDYDTAVEPPPGSKGFSVAPFYPTSVTERRDDGQTSFEPSPKVRRIRLAEIKQPRPAQVAALHRQKSAMGIQNPSAERDRVRLSKFREMIDMQEGRRPFANFPPTINERTVDNGFTMGTEHNISHQRPTTPPLTGFYKSSGPYSRIWKVSTPPALSPRHGTTSTAKGPAQRIDVPPHLLYQEHMSPQPGESRYDADVRQAMTVYPPGDLIKHQQRGQQSRHLNVPVDANEPEIALARQSQYQQERLAAQKQQQAGRASGSLSLRSSPEQTEPGGPQQSAGLAHQQAQQFHQMLMQQGQAIAMRDAQSQATNQAAVMAHQALQTFSKDNSNGLLVLPSSFAPEWGFGRNSNMPPSPLIFQTPVDPNGPSFAPDDSAEGKRKTSDQGNMPVQPNDERHNSPRTFKDTSILCSVYRFPQGRVQSTISEDHTTNVSKRRKLNFMALGQSKSYGAKTKQHLRRGAEPNGRMRALIKV